MKINSPIPRIVTEQYKLIILPDDGSAPEYQALEAETQWQIRNNTEREGYRWRLNVHKDELYRRLEVRGHACPDKLTFTNEHVYDQAACYIFYYHQNERYMEYAYYPPMYFKEPLKRRISRIRIPNHVLRTSPNEETYNKPDKRDIPYNNLDQKFKRGYHQEWHRSKLTGRLHRRWPFQYGVYKLTQRLYLSWLESYHDA